ncbi:J domain-containing protein [Nocardia rhizosphaerae]|uniref:Tetratricopeptide repeat protein n=1 Tax=Nocardia rhizosphaerae TaxID=1691571 RepID=A0ABV8LD45_9NOCA
MTVKVDYYDLLGVARDADDDTIRTAHKRQTRIWTKRTASADLSTRQEAETKSTHLREAYEILLEPAKRRAYDRDLSTGGVVGPAAPVEGGDWLAQARAALGRGDYRSAAYAAREATHTAGNSPEAWIIRARANAGIGQLQDAIYEARQATTIAPNNPEYLFQTALIQEQMQQWADALSSYQAAARLAPEEFIYHVAIGGVYLQHGLVDKALEVLEPVYARHSGEELVAFYLANALLDKAEKTPRVQNDDSYVVTSEDEITAMRTLVERATSLPSNDFDIANRARDILEYLDGMEQMAWEVPGLFGFSTPRAIGIPLVAAVLAFIMISAGAAGIGFLLVLAAAGIGFLVYTTCWVPRWKAAGRLTR